MRLIDADKILYVYAPIAPVLVGNKVHYEKIAFQKEIDKLPTVDAVPVIRCKDCKHSDYWRRCRKLRNMFDAHEDVSFEETFFCAYGERKNDETD